MSSPKSRFTLLTILLVFAISAGVILQKLPPHLAKELEENARASRISLEITKPAFTAPKNLVAEKITVLAPIQSVPIPFLFSDIKLTPHLFKLLAGRITTDFNLKLYDGTLKGRYTLPLFSNLTNLKLKIENLVLEKHPLLPFYGIDGKLNFETNLNISKTDPFLLEETPLFKLNIRELNYLGGHKISIDGLYLPLTSPSLRDLNLDIIANSKKGIIDLEKLTSTSSLGKIDCKGKAELSKDYQLRTISLNCSIALSEEGKDILGDLFNLTLPIPPENTASDWNLAIRKSPKDEKPSLSLIPKP